MPDAFVVRAEDLELSHGDLMSEIHAAQCQAHDDLVWREYERLLGRNLWWRNGAEHYWPTEGS